MKPLVIKCSDNERERREQLAEATRTAAQGHGVIWENAQGNFWAQYFPAIKLWLNAEGIQYSTIYAACGFDAPTKCGHPAGCWTKTTGKEEAYCGWCRAIAERDEAVAHQEQPMTATEKQLTDAAARVLTAARHYSEIHHRSVAKKDEPARRKPRLRARRRS